MISRTSLNFFLLLSFCSLLPSVLSAQDNGLEPSIPVDSSSVRAGDWDSPGYRSMIQSEDFNYEQDIQNPESLWQRIRNWLIRSLFDLLQNDLASFILKVIFFITFALVLFGLIRQYLGGNIQGSFSKTDRNSGFDLNSDIREIKDQDLREAYQKALRDTNYPLAVRYLYLLALKDLDQKGLLEIKKNKTNHEYLSELSSTDWYDPFSKLTRYYDYIEYGEFPIGEESFQRVRSVYFRIAGEDSL